MQPVLLHLRWFTQPTSVAWVYGACALVAAGFAALAWRSGARDLRRLGPWIAAMVGLGLVAYLRRGHLLPVADFVVTSSGASLVLAAVTGWIVILGLSERVGVPGPRAASAFFVAGLAGVLSARWMYLLANPHAVLNWASWVSVRGGGLLGYPGLIVGLGVGAWWVARGLEPKRASVTSRKWLDAAAPGLALGAAIVRGGCYLFGCDYGRVLPGDSSEWLKDAGTFPHWSEHTLDGWGAPAWVAQVNSGAIQDAARESLPVHPTQLYELGLGVLLFAGLVWVRPRCSKPGQAFALFLLGYAWVRLSVDLLRGDVDRGMLGPAFEGRLLLALAWLVWGLLAGFAAGHLVKDARWRSSLRVGLLLPGVAMFLVRLGRPPWDALSVSLNQWLALLSSVAAAAGFHWIERQRLADESEETEAGEHA